MKLIVGLGNPGEKYENTRHNVGFQVIDLLAEKENVSLKFDKNMNAELGKKIIDGETTLLVKPHSFMNESGIVVSKVRSYFKARTEDIVVVHDDLDIPAGEFKISFARNSGGHLGVQSIIDTLKTKDFYRVRLGIAVDKLNIARSQANEDAKRDMISNFVLSKFTAEELKTFKNISSNVVSAIINSTKLKRPSANWSENTSS
jgi:PTH1 family peptidyl-tRNA hydrolase